MSFDIPLTPVEGVTPEEIEALKPVLTAWILSRSHLPAGKVSLTIERAEKVSAYQLFLQVLQETRLPKLESIIRPFTEDMKPVDVPLPREKINVWDYPSEPPLDFQVRREVHLVSPTIQKRDCQDCFKKGQTNCRTCFGKGQSACTACLGAGSQACDLCKGVGRSPCLKCEGQGRIAAGGMTNRTLGTCEVCKGTGRLHCRYCSQGKADCSTCGTTGRQTCPSCAGHGQMPCSSCKGKKQLAVGLAYTAEFRPVQLEGAAMGLPAPPSILDLALAEKKPARAFELSPDGSLEEEVKASSLPDPVKKVLADLLEKSKPASTTSTRPAKRRLTLVEGSMVRLTGTLLDQPFTYWLQPATRAIYVEKDPLKDMGQTNSSAALEAVKTGQWKKACDSAQQTLRFDPKNVEGQGVLRQWSRRTFFESLGFSLSAGAAASLGFASYILFGERGVHKGGPISSGVLTLMVLSAALGVAVWPLAQKMFRRRLRWSVCFGGVLAVLLGFTAAAREFFQWNSLKAGDQEAVDKAMRQHFKFGVSRVYWPPDLAFLEDLNDRYKDSEADLSQVTAAIESQKSLKTQRDALADKFNGELNDVLASSLPWDVKRQKIGNLRGYYALRGVDVSAADKAVKNLTPGAGSSAYRHAGRLLIKSEPPAPRSKSAASVRRPAKKVPAKKTSVSSSKSKKKKTPAHYRPKKKPSSQFIRNPVINLK